MKFSNNISFAFALGTVMIMASCANESPWQDSSDAKDGRIELSVATNSTVTLGTRADDSEALQPNISDFAISLKSEDGSIDRTWESLSKFNSEDGFPMGSYTLSAHYGDLEVEGFEKPYYYGEEQIEVILGETTETTILATLANSMISIRYSSDLTSMFSAYSGALQTSSGNTVSFVQEEDRPAYINPGESKLLVTLTNDKDETVTVNLASLQLSARHHYIVTVGVNKDNMGTNILDVNVTEDIFVEDPIEIKLTDEFFGAPVPVVTAEGFDPQKSLDFFEAFTTEIGTPQIHVMALAGLQSAKLKLSKTSNGETTDEVVELIGAESDVKSRLESEKINCVGFFGNTAEFGYIDFTEYVKNLTPGSYKASLEVTDKLGRTVDATLPIVELKANVDEVLFEIAGVKIPKFLDDKIYAAVSTNCPLLGESFIFQSKDQDGSLVEVSFKRLEENKEIEELTEKYENTYFYELNVDEINDCRVTLTANYSTKSDSKILDVIMPEFVVETDAFAKQARMRLTSSSLDYPIEKLLDYLKIRNGDKALSFDVYDKSEGMITVKGLTAKNEGGFSGNYELTLYLGKSTSENYKGTLAQFTTEEALDVPNGDFEDLAIAFRGVGLTRGGSYKVALLGSGTYINTADFEISEPINWITNNNISMNNKSVFNSSDDTWFNQPSVFNSSLTYEATVPQVRYTGITWYGGETKTPDSYDNLKPAGDYTGNAMVLRNVGWSANGTLPSTQTATKSNGAYYNTNAPSVSNKNVGKMYLGSEASEGIKFPSRPLQLTGYFTYKNDSNDPDELGYVIIDVLDNSGKSIAQGKYEFKATSVYTNFEIPLNYEWGNNSKADSIKILISSSNHENESEISLTSYNSQFESYMLGATLVVDEFNFIYE